MATEKSLRYLIGQRAEKIKRLKNELQTTITLKKISEGELRELRWEAKDFKKVAKSYQHPDRIDKAIETMAAKINRKATKKKVIKKLYRPNVLVK